MTPLVKLISGWRAALRRVRARIGRTVSPYRRVLLWGGVGVGCVLLSWGGYASGNIWRENRAALALSQVQATLKPLHSVLLGGLPIRGEPDKTAVLEKAVAEYLSIAERYPGTAAAEQALVSRGNLLMAVGRTEEALGAYTRYIERYPRGYLTVLAYVSTGYVWEAQGKLEEAHRAYSHGWERAGKDNPLGAEAALGLARILQSQKKEGEAQEILQSVMSSYPDTLWSTTARFSFSRR